MSFGLLGIENTFVLSMVLTVMTFRSREFDLTASSRPTNVEQTKGQSKSSQSTALPNETVVNSS
jgi:hypothetical protein